MGAAGGAAGGGGGGGGGMGGANPMAFWANIAQTAGNVVSIVSAGTVQKEQLKQQARQMERALQETKKRAADNANVMEESAKQMIGMQQAARSTQGKIGGAGNDYLVYSDTMDKLAKNVTNLAHEVGYELHNQRYETTLTDFAAKNAMTKAWLAAKNELDAGFMRAMGMTDSKKPMDKALKEQDEGSTTKYSQGMEQGWSKAMTPGKLGQG